jgi:hypothetical protein
VQGRQLSILSCQKGFHSVVVIFVLFWQEQESLGELFGAQRQAYICVQRIILESCVDNCTGAQKIMLWGSYVYINLFQYQHMKLRLEQEERLCQEHWCSSQFSLTVWYHNQQ